MDERIYLLYKPVDKDLIGEELKSKHAQMTSVWELPPETGITWAPNPFPIELPARCIYSVLDDGKGRVIDPYAGSGTTLVAAKLMGLEYFGIEISPEYAKRALERLENAHRELPRLQAELEAHKVEKTFQQRKEEGMWAKRQKRGLEYSQAKAQRRLLEKPPKVSPGTSP